ncbi:MAG TPA: family 20 glycosylhydrolase, partial [Chitinophagaceae bacterium]|nr:family 20 glycosylhydrolase [Chitinophagaceae bacterium]
AQTQDGTISIIPLPVHMSLGTGYFSINTGTAIYTDNSNQELQKLANELNKQLETYYGMHLPIRNAKGPQKQKGIWLRLNDAADSLGDEGYTLTINPQQVHLQAHTPAGIFYGLESLYQLLPAEKKKFASLRLPAVKIADRPRYAWRGMLLDVGRYFYSVDFIKKYIDYLAMHKMNTFHWHLTEDQGWRIEIKKYPKLTEVGAWRDQTLIGHARIKPHQYDGKKSGGFYTQEQIREIVSYAKDRFVTVIPEIEMPGHSTAALAAYPELSCTGGPFKVSETWGVHDNVYCAGNEKTFAFLEDVLSEVCDLFPSSIIHIGGDECPKTRWKACPKCQARIKAEGLKDEHELQSYFIRRIEKFLLSKHKNIIGWDEILEGGLAPNAAVMSWRGIQGGIEAAKQKHYVVMAPGEYMYLDHYQGDPSKEPLAISGYTTMEKVYSYDPTPESLSPEEQKYIRGAEGTIWTEYISTPEHAEYMMMPRMAALSEIMWTPLEKKNWEDFKRRMQKQYKRYDAAGIHYARSNFEVQPFVRYDTASGQAIVLLKTDSYGTEIRYSTDGSEPTMESKKYDAPFAIGKNCSIKAAAFENDQKISQTAIQDINLPR